MKLQVAENKLFLALKELVKTQKQVLRTKDSERISSVWQDFLDSDLKQCKKSWRQVAMFEDQLARVKETQLCLALKVG